MAVPKVLIIGGGPAGCAIGIELLAQGITPILLEKRGKEKNKLCGGLITNRGIRQLELLKIPLIPSIFFNSSKVRFYNCGEKILDYQSSKGFYCVRRQAFDNLLQEEYTSRGGILSLNSPVISIDQQKQLVTTSNGTSYDYDFLIGADGVNGLSSRATNPNPPKPALCLEVFVPKSNGLDGINVIFGVVQKGFSWCFENDNSIGIGLGAIDYGSYQDLKQSYELLLQTHGKSIEGTPKPRAALVPYSGRNRTIAQNKIILVGDAAGFVDPILGEGISYALESGRLAARAIVAPKPIEAYKKSVSFLSRRIQAGLRMRKLFFNPTINKFVLNEFRKHPGRTAHICDNLVLDGSIGYEDLLGMIKLAIGRR